MCHTFLASLQQIFQNPLDDFHTQWYFSCKSHCSCGLVWTFPQDVVVFILNTASPWIIPEKFTAPQHTRFILPSVSPDKILRLYCVAVFFFSGKLNLESFISHLNVIPCHDLTLSVSEPDNAAAQTGAGTSFGANGDQHTRAVELSTYFCVLTIRKQLSETCFERSGRGQEPSRGHKFSILENVVLHRDFTSSMRLHFRSDLVGACLPQTLPSNNKVHNCSMDWV